MTTTICEALALPWSLATPAAAMVLGYFLAKLEHRYTPRSPRDLKERK